MSKNKNNMIFCSCRGRKRKAFDWDGARCCKDGKLINEKPKSKK